MKVLVHISLIAACLIAYAHGLPGARRDSLEDDLEDNFGDTTGFDLAIPNFFSDTFMKLRQNVMNYFWSMPNITDMKIPEGANTTSTTKIINGHVVTINETTYSASDDTSGTAFRIRIIDVKPQNDILTSDDTTPKAQPAESAETVEAFNNEIPKEGDMLTA